MEIVAKSVPAREDWSALGPGFEKAKSGGLGDLESADHGFAQAFAAKSVGACRQQWADPAEFRDQLLRLGLGVAARDRESEKIFDQLVVEERLAAAFEKPLAEPRSVASGAG